MSARDIVTGEFDISAKEGRILREIVAAYVTKNVITVNHILALKIVGSQATNHAILKNLINKKLVLSINDPLDLRIKHLKPSPSSLELFARLSNEFMRCANKKTKPVNVSIGRK
jgi:DNA-binding MarR family transcriptional regulator